jgi:hypothetical protein
MRFWGSDDLAAKAWEEFQRSSRPELFNETDKS